MAEKHEPREFPKMLYHPKHAPKVVHSPEDEAAAKQHGYRTHAEHAAAPPEAAAAEGTPSPAPSPSRSGARKAASQPPSQDRT